MAGSEVKSGTRCETCRWWHKYKKDTPDGTCRRYPPLVVWNGREREATQYSPETEPSHWCGEWKER